MHLTFPDIRVEPHKEKKRVTHYTATLRDKQGNILCEAMGATAVWARLHLVEVIMKTLAALPSTSQRILRWYGSTAVVYPVRRGQWTYDFADNRGGQWYLSGCTFYDTEKEAERAARKAIAWREWDGIAETSGILLNEEDQREFTERAIWSKQLRQLEAQGWSYQEASYLLHGRARYHISPARLAEMPELPDFVKL